MNLYMHIEKTSKVALVEEDDINKLNAEIN